MSVSIDCPEDISAMVDAKTEDDYIVPASGYGGLTNRFSCFKPIIAAVNGPAVGWGMELAIMADIRIASTAAKFGELFVVRGLCCDAPGLGRLAQLVGRSRAAELLFTGEVIDAERALALGLVSDVVAPDAIRSLGSVRRTPPPPGGGPCGASPCSTDASASPV